MRRGQRPSRHIRRVRTKQGKKVILINQSINNRQYRKIMGKIALFADADKDGIRNIDDCRPFDKKRHSEKTISEMNRDYEETGRPIRVKRGKWIGYGE